VSYTSSLYGTGNVSYDLLSTCAQTVAPSSCAVKALEVEVAFVVLGISLLTPFRNLAYASTRFSQY